MLGLMISCNKSGGGTSAVGENSSSNSATKVENQSATVNVIVKANGSTYSISDMDPKKSYLQFYTADSEIKQDGNFKIQSKDGSASMTVIIDGLNAKGADLIKGQTQIDKNNTVILYKKGDTEIRFVEGELMVSEVSKITGTVKVKASGTCTIKKGKSYTDLEIDIPAELNLEATISDIKTLNYKK